MSENHSFLALDWVKGEIEETLKQARQALEAFVENPEDSAQMRFCLAYLHQVYGTLQVVEFYGAALLAEEMEKTCLALINGQVARVTDGQEVLMRAILQLPPYLERVKSSRRDLPVVVLPLLNDLRAARGEALLSETALFTPDLAAGERAPIQVAAAAVDTALLKKIRQVYQLALLGFIRNESVSDNLKKMGQVFARLETVAGATPIRELWLVTAAIVEGLQHKTIEVGTSIKMLLGQVDRQLRMAVEDSALRAPTELLKNLLYYVAKSNGDTPRLRSIKELYRLDDALPGEALVSEERARMSGPDREAMKSVVDALCEELARVKDALDLFVRKSVAERSINELTTLVPILKQVADTVAVLGLGQPRRILQEQIEVIDAASAHGILPEDGTLLDVAGALLYVEATLMGMVAEKPLGASGKNAAAEFSAQDQLSDAQAAVLRESRSALEKAKDAVIEYIASQWNPVHLQSIPELIDSVRGSLAILSLQRPADLLVGARAYISERLLSGQHRPDWQEMDTLADVITSVEYYLERIANDTHGGDHILDIAERSLGKLGYGDAAGVAAEPVSAKADVTSHEPDAGEWQAAEEAAFEAEMAEAMAPVAPDLPVEQHEDEVLIGATDETALRPVPDELKEMQERLHVGDFGEPALDDMAVESASFQELAEEGAAASIDTDSWELEETADLGELEAALDAQATEQDLVPADVNTEVSALDSDIALDDLELLSDVDVKSGATPDTPLENADAGLAPFEDTLRLEEPLPEPVVEAAVPVVEPPKKPVLPVLTVMPEDDHSFDEEIREIFVEEAEEVLQNINEYFPKWAANFDDTESLLEFRRGFHTLKGSGRMVGAKVVGELAWAFENMLNKVRDKILPPDQILVNAVSECLALIPGLVEDFARRQSPRYDTSPLMAAAEAISRGEKLSAMDLARAAEQAQGNADVESEGGTDAFDALAASLAPDLPAETFVAESGAEHHEVVPEDSLAFLDDDAASAGETATPLLDDLSAELEASFSEESADAGPAPVPAIPVEAVPEPEIDPMLLEIFSGEAEMHLEVIQQYLDGLDPERSTAVISDEVLRSLHTLKGSAGMAGIRPVAEIAAPMEHLFKDLRNQIGHAKRDHLQSLRDSHRFIRDSIADLNQGGNGRVSGAEELISHIRQLDQERLAHLEKEQLEKLTGESSTALTAATQGLVASFMQLGIDHVLDASWELEGWLAGPDAASYLDALRQELSYLQEAAQQKQVDALALLCERLAAVYARIAAQELASGDKVLGVLLVAHEEIINIFDTLAASQTVQPDETLLAQLQALLQAPAVTVASLSDEPAVVAFQPEEQPSLGELVIGGEDSAWQEPAALNTVEAVDPELLEIFLEEADEVLEAAQEELDNWKRDNENLAALAALQRHLHTLKGGARLAEIRALGDLAHELEFLYEGLVDGRYQSSPDLLQLLQRCHDRLADMVMDLRANGRCPASIELVNAINAYRRAPGAVVEASANHDFSADALQSPPRLDDVPAGAVDAPAALLDAAAPAADDEAIPVSEGEPLASGLDIGEPAPEVTEEALFEEATAALADASAVDDNEAVFAEFFPEAAAQTPAIEAVEAAPAPAPAAAAPAPAPAPVAMAQDFDPELLEIFLEEAGEIVDATSEQLAAWQRDPNNTLPVQQLQRGLHTLKGGARMAEINALGDLAHHLEFLYEGVCEGLMTTSPALFSLLHRCHDRLAESVDALRHQSACPATDDLVRQIKSYIADPEHFQDAPTAVSLKPVAAPVEPVEEVEPEVTPAAPVEPPAPKAIDAAPVPEHVDSDILEIFMEESEELAEGIESSLNEWLENRDDSAPMEALMRHLHTLKGGARLAGLKALGDLAHDWETDLVAIQSGSRAADDTFFASLNSRLEAVLGGIKAVRSGVESAAPSAPAAAEAAPEVVPVSTAAAPAPAAQESAAVVPFPNQAQPVAAGAQIKPPSMLGGFQKDTAARGPQEMIRVPSDLLEKLVNLAGETSITRSRVEMGVHGFAQTVEEMGATISRLAEQLRRMDSEMETQIVARHGDESGKYEDFDPLEMDQYSSLNQLSKSLAESASDLLDLKSTLLDKARDTETLLLQQARINTELQEGLMRSRMVPFSRLVPRLKRIVRQTGQEVGKPADLEVINPEGEMDRTLLERIVAPLEHMLRNSVDHGIEDPAGRAAAGKPAQGRVTLTLTREGGEVVLTLADDGRGINIPAVRKKALERGLITEGQDISDQDVIQFIFHAGFSTASAVTQISGRGVGMDVVQSEIKQMGGVVSIHSVTGQGTTFTIRLPFTVAVNRALMVRVGEDSYAIPLAQIEGIVRASPYELETYYGPDAPLFEYAGITYKLNYLGEFVHGVKSPNLVGQTMPLPVLLIRGGEQHFAIQVDQLIGSREIVVKAVGSQLATVAGISGATILGDGSVVIILDVTAMLRAASLTTPRISVGSIDALPAPAETQRTRQVMVVDDSVTVRKVTSRLLERHGYEVLLAKDGMDAIAKLEDARPDIMLLDIEMPRMDGFEVATLVRHNPNLEDLPIIMITSRTGEKHRERAFQIGVNCYMGKPFQEEQLLETIAELLAATAVK